MPGAKPRCQLPAAYFRGLQCVTLGVHAGEDRMDPGQRHQGKYEQRRKDPGPHLSCRLRSAEEFAGVEEACNPSNAGLPLEKAKQDRLGDSPSFTGRQRFFDRWAEDHRYSCERDPDADSGPE